MSAPLVPWSLTWLPFLPSHPAPGVGHTLASIPGLSFLPPSAQTQVIRSHPPPQPLPGGQGLLKSCFPSMAMPAMLLCTPSYFFLPCSTMAFKSSPFSDISCRNLSALRRHPPQYKHRSDMRMPPVPASVPLSILTLFMSWYLFLLLQKTSWSLWLRITDQSISLIS